MATVFFEGEEVYWVDADEWGVDGIGTVVHVDLYDERVTVLWQDDNTTSVEHPDSLALFTSIDELEDY